MWILGQISRDAVHVVHSGGPDFEDIIGLVAVGGFFLAAIVIVSVVTVCRTFQTIRVTKHNSSLITNLADRGFDPEMIERIVSASSGGKPMKIPGNCKPPRSVNVPPQKPIVHQHV